VTHYTKSASGCVLSSDNSGSLYTLGREVLASDLVKLSIERTPASGRIQLSYGVSVDGARLSLGPFDTQLDRECLLFRSLDLQTHQCLATGATSNQYADSACTTRKAAAMSSCPAPKFMFAPDPRSSCPVDLIAYRVGAPTSASPLFAIDENRTCVARPAEPGTSYFEVGESVDVQRFTRDPASSDQPRIQNITYTDGTVHFPLGELRDSRYGDDCLPTRLPDGTVRCIPRAAPSAGTFYSDSTCQTLVTLLPTALPFPCPLAATPRTFSIKSGTCGSTIQTFSVGALYTGPLFQKIFTLCLLTTSPVAYNLLTPIPLTEFAIGVQGQDP
jgi:hypothetical protein